jgi:hypothetical protein
MLARSIEVARKLWGQAQSYPFAPTIVGKTIRPSLPSLQFSAFNAAPANSDWRANRFSKLGKSVVGNWKCRQVARLADDSALEQRHRSKRADKRLAHAIHARAQPAWPFVLWHFERYQASSSRVQCGWNRLARTRVNETIISSSTATAAAESAWRILFLDDLRRPHGQAPMSLLSFRVFPIN